jgi:geranylgeranyl pyrophosphate synthase
MKSTAAPVPFEAQLADYKVIVEASVAEFCDRVERQAKDEFGPYSAEATKVFNDILKRGGKRVRGALVIAAYEMCGGTDVTKIMPLVTAIEILQAYLLIADDIYDRSATRRGGPTAHVMMERLHAKHKWVGDSEHFGESIASCATLIGNNLAMEEIARAPIDDHAKVAIFTLINEALRITDYGQINDIFNAATRNSKEGHVQNTLLWKSAYYSFTGPLGMGAIAAGADDAALVCLHEYGVHIGLSFMIADDILGTFGNEQESGKSNTDDLREGKMTMLVSRALAKATPAQRKILLAYVGKPDLTTAEYEACKTVIVETGALDYARNLALKEAEKSVAALQRASATWRPDKLQFLRELADFMVSRHT